MVDTTFFTGGRRPGNRCKFLYINNLCTIWMPFGTVLVCSHLVPDLRYPLPQRRPKKNERPRAGARPLFGSSLPTTVLLTVLGLNSGARPSRLDSAGTPVCLPAELSHIRGPSGSAAYARHERVDPLVTGTSRPS